MLCDNSIKPYRPQFVHPIIHDFAPSTGVEFDPWRGPDDNVIVRYVPFLERDGSPTENRWGAPPDTVIVRCVPSLHRHASLTENGWAAPALFPIIDSLSEKQRNRVGFG